MALCRWRSIWLGRCTENPAKIEPGLGSDCVNIGTLMQHPLRLEHISPSQERTRGSTICHSVALPPKTTTQTICSIFLVFPWFKEEKQKREGCHVSLLKGSGFPKRRYTICFLTVDGLSRLSLLGFGHTAPRPPFWVPGKQIGERLEQD